MRIVFIVISSLLICASSQAHPYFPLNKGSVSTYNYKFGVDSENKEVTKSNTTGKMISRNQGEIEKEGKRFYQFQTNYEGISYMTGTAELWRREEDGNLYLGSFLKGKFNETLELPGDVTVGKEWDYNDGEISKRKVTAILSITLPDGAKLDDCIEVTRSILNEKLKNIVNKTYYCRDTGDAGSLFAQPSPFGEYKTEVSLLSYKSGD